MLERMLRIVTEGDPDASASPTSNSHAASSPSSTSSSCSSYLPAVDTAEGLPVEGEEEPRLRCEERSGTTPALDHAAEIELFVRGTLEREDNEGVKRALLFCNGLVRRRPGRGSGVAHCHPVAASRAIDGLKT